MEGSVWVTHTLQNPTVNGLLGGQRSLPNKYLNSRAHGRLLQAPEALHLAHACPCMAGHA